VTTIFFTAVCVMSLGWGWPGYMATAVGTICTILLVSAIVRQFELMSRQNEVPLPGHHPGAGGPAMLIPDQYRMGEISAAHASQGRQVRILDFRVACRHYALQTPERARAPSLSHVPVRVKSVQSHVTLSPQTGQQAGTAPPVALPAGWRELVNVNGMSYYQNNITRVTQWERPQEAARQVRIFDSILLVLSCCCSDSLYVNLRLTSRVVVSLIIAPELIFRQ
jgi:hypothetical protein